MTNLSALLYPGGLVYGKYLNAIHAWGLAYEVFNIHGKYLNAFQNLEI